MIELERNFVENNCCSFVVDSMIVVVDNIGHSCFVAENNYHKFVEHSFVVGSLIVQHMIVVVGNVEHSCFVAESNHHSSAEHNLIVVERNFFVLLVLNMFVEVELKSTIILLDEKSIKKLPL